MSVYTLKVVFPDNYPVIRKTIRIDSSLTVTEAIQTIAEAIHIPDPGTVGIFIPPKMVRLDAEKKLQEYPELQDVVCPFPFPFFPPFPFSFSLSLFPPFLFPPPFSLSLSSFPFPLLWFTSFFSFYLISFHLFTLLLFFIPLPWFSSSISRLFFSSSFAPRTLLVSSLRFFAVHPPRLAVSSSPLRFPFGFAAIPIAFSALTVPVATVIPVASTLPSAVPATHVTSDASQDEVFFGEPQKRHKNACTIL